MSLDYLTKPAYTNLRKKWEDKGTVSNYRRPFFKFALRLQCLTYIQVSKAFVICVASLLKMSRSFTTDRVNLDQFKS